MKKWTALLLVCVILSYGGVQAEAITIHRSLLRRIFSPQLNSNTMSTSTISDFFLGRNIVETVLSGTSNSTTTVKDIIYNYFAPGNIETGCSLFVQDSGNTPVYTAINPSIATVNSVGSTTYVSAGSARFNVRLGRRTKTISCDFARTGNVPSYTFNTVVSTSTIKNIKDQVDTRISGLTPSSTTYNIYSATNDSMQTYTRNTNMFAYDVDLTCIPVYSGAISSAQTMGVLVAPDILIQANHSHPNGTMYFVKNDNTTVSRSITSGSTIAGTDIYVAKLSSDVPAGITPCKIFSATAFTNSISTTSLSYYQPPVIYTNQNRVMRIAKINYDSTYTDFNKLIRIVRGAGDYYNWYTQPCCGDSGSPAFALVSGQPILLGTWYTAYSVPNLSNYITEINSTMTSLGSPHALSTVSLSGFHSF
jgi:hypothetical protein